MEPVTTTLLVIGVGLASQAFGGIVGNRADEAFCKVLEQIFFRLRQRKPNTLQLNHDIERAVRRSYLLATLTICEECLEENTTHLDWRERLALVQNGERQWLITTRRALRLELEQLEKSPPSSAPVIEQEQVALLLTPRAVSYEEQVALLKTQLRDGLLQEVARFGEPPPIFVERLDRDRNDDGDLTRIGWFSLVCALFTDDYRHNPRTRAALDGYLLADLYFGSIPIHLQSLQAELERQSGITATRLEGISHQLEHMRSEHSQNLASVAERLDSLLPQLLLLPTIADQQRALLQLAQFSQQNNSVISAAGYTVEQDQYRGLEPIQSKRTRLRAAIAYFGDLQSRAIVYGKVVPPDIQDELDTLEQVITNLKSEIRNEISTHLSPLPVQRYSSFIGRESDKQQIAAVLDDSDAHPIVAIDGIGGSGKTALAREVTKLAIASGSFYAAVWESAKPVEYIGGQLQPLSTAEIDFGTLLDAIGRKLGYFEVLSCRTIEEKENLVTRILASERYLIVVDNLETIEGYRNLVTHFVPLTGTSKILLTTRERIADIQAVYSWSLKGLNVQESIHFLRSWAATHGEQAEVILYAEDESLERIHLATGGLPLAMELVAGQAMNSSVERVIERLHQVHYRDFQERGTDQDIYSKLFRYIYWDAWSQLADLSREILISLGTFDLNEGADTDELQAANALSKDQVLTATGELSSFALIRRTIENGKQSFFLHPLTYYFVQADLPAS